jgi:hypothetical protein
MMATEVSLRPAASEFPVGRVIDPTTSNSTGVESEQNLAAASEIAVGLMIGNVTTRQREPGGNYGA